VGLAADARDLRALLDSVADRARHLSLELGRFTVEAHFDRSGELTVPKREQRNARLRRATVILAANTVFEECIEDYRMLDDVDALDSAVEDPLLVPDADGTFVYRFFPRRFRRAYDHRFFANVAATTAKVAYDLARPDAGPPACVAEEIVLSGVFAYAERMMDQAQLGRPWMDLTEMMLEDTDFEMLFTAGFDGIEDDPAMQRNLGVWVPGPRDWFAPFNSGRVVHPFSETAVTGPRPHDLHHLAVEADISGQVGDPSVADDPSPISGLVPVSEAVALAREEARQSADAGSWIADADNPEASMAACQQAAKVSASGWLTWEPHERADMTRTDSVVRFVPHRHFRAGPDQPWAEVAISSVIMYVPLAAVVSYRPDPEVHRSWDAAFKNLLDG
jgi:hypothetical protein